MQSPFKKMCEYLKKKTKFPCPGGGRNRWVCLVHFFLIVGAKFSIALSSPVCHLFVRFWSISFFGPFEDKN
jgi:hypothetical protein